MWTQHFQSRGLAPISSQFVGQHLATLYLKDHCHLTRVHNFDTVESGHTQRNFRNATPICILFEKAFIPAWTLEETESVLLNLGKCWKPKGTNKPRMQKRGDKEKPSQREGTHLKMCVINVRSLVSSIYSRCWSRPPCPNLIGSVNLNQLVIQRQGKREKLKLRQLNAKLSQPWKQTQGERKEITSILHAYTYISLLPEPGYEATRTSYPPKLFVEQRTCGRSLPHAEQVDPTSHNYTFDNNTCT